MARSMSRETFLKYVATTIERQLQEWNASYAVVVLKLTDYHVWVNGTEEYYELSVAVDELEQLQKSSPYALDRHIWRLLQNQGLSIEKGYGDYIEFVMQ